MNPLPRLLGLSLFVVLVVLTALLAAPFLSPPKPAHPNTPAPAAQSRLAGLPRRLALPLAATSLVLTGALLVSLALRPAAPGTPPPFAAATRTEMGALSKLAQSTAAQGAALEQERHVRERAEADAQLNQRLYVQSFEEKVRLGHDLHDGIIQSLYATGLNLESARALIHDDPAEASRRLAECRQSLNTTIREVRTYIHGLTPSHLLNSGFGQAVQNLAAELSAGRSVLVDVGMDETAVALLTPDQAAEALQIVREAISNSLRHGAAKALKIRLQNDDRELCLLVQDNGCGFDPARTTGTGHGLANLRARAARLGASARIESSPGAGARVVLTLPLRV